MVFCYGSSSKLIQIFLGTKSHVLCYPSGMISTFVIFYYLEIVKEGSEKRSYGVYEAELINKGNASRCMQCYVFWTAEGLEWTGPPAFRRPVSWVALSWGR